MGFNCPHCQKEVQNAVPLERFTELTNEKKAAAEKAASLEQQLQSTAQEWSKKEAGWKGREQLFASGLTNPEVVDVAMLAYERLPADNRPAVGEWARGHALFKSYFPAPAAPPTEAQQQAPAAPQAPAPATPAPTPAPTPTPAPALPSSNATAAAGNAPATSGYSGEAIANMTLEQYREHRAAILGKKP